MPTLGQLRHRITLENKTAGDDWGTEATWSAHLTDIYASIEPLTGKELVNAQQVSAETTHKVTIRHRDGINERMRIVHGSDVLHISGIINPGQQDEWLELAATLET